MLNFLGLEIYCHILHIALNGISHWGTSLMTCNCGLILQLEDHCCVAKWVQAWSLYYSQHWIQRFSQKFSIVRNQCLFQRIASRPGRVTLFSFHSTNWQDSNHKGLWGDTIWFPPIVFFRFPFSTSYCPSNLDLAFLPLIGAQVPFLSLGNFDYAITRLSYSHSIVSLFSLLIPLPSTQFSLDLSLWLSLDSELMFHIFNKMMEICPPRHGYIDFSSLIRIQDLF